MTGQEATVLLVDDDDNVLNGLQRVLRKEPWQLLAAQSAAEALQLLEREVVDVVISDERMPGTSGTELLARVSRMYPRILRIMFTGKATLDTAMQAINVGSIQRFFTKPYNHTELAIAVRELLRQRELMENARELLRTVRSQQRLLATLEQKYPGITSVPRDQEGAVLLDDVPSHYEEFLAAMRAQIGQKS